MAPKLCVFPFPKSLPRSAFGNFPDLAGHPLHIGHFDDPLFLEDLGRRHERRREEFGTWNDERGRIFRTSTEESLHEISNTLHQITHTVFKIRTSLNQGMLSFPGSLGCERREDYDVQVHTTTLMTSQYHCTVLLSNFQGFMGCSIRSSELVRQTQMRKSPFDYKRFQEALWPCLLEKQN